MVLIRIAYSASLPSPAEILDGLKKNSDLTGAIVKEIAAPRSLEQAPLSTSGKEKTVETRADALCFNTPEDLIKYLSDIKELMTAYSLKNDVSFVEFKNGAMKINASDKINNDFLLNLQRLLTKATGICWNIDIRSGVLGETIADKEAARDMESKKDVMDLPLVKAILAEFHGARIDSLTRKATQQEENAEAASFEEENNYFDEDNDA